MNQYKLEVDSYTENHQDEVFECSCIIAGSDVELDKTVTFDELIERVADSKVMVECTNPNDTQETEPIPFWVWYKNNRGMQAVKDELEDIINKREGRTKSYIWEKHCRAFDISDVLRNMSK